MCTKPRCPDINLWGTGACLISRTDSPPALACAEEGVSQDCIVRFMKSPHRTNLGDPSVSWSQDHLQRTTPCDRKSVASTSRAELAAERLRSSQVVWSLSRSKQKEGQER